MNVTVAVIVTTSAPAGNGIPSTRIAGPAPTNTGSRTGGEGMAEWSQAGSNRRPPACKAGALPAELWPRAAFKPRIRCTCTVRRRMHALRRHTYAVQVSADCLRKK